MRMWLFVEHFRSILAPSLPPHRPSYSRSRSLSHSVDQSVRRAVLLILLSPPSPLRDLCLSPSFSFPRAALFLVRSPGPEVVMSDSVVRLVASCRIAANDDVTLETSRLVIQVVSCSVA